MTQIQEGVNMTTAPQLPAGVKEEDHKLEAAHETAQEELAALRWFWTLNESNPERVSIRVYAEEIGHKNWSPVRRMAIGYGRWMSVSNVGYTLGECIQRAEVSDATEAAIDALATASKSTFTETKKKAAEVKATKAAATKAAKADGVSAPTDEHYAAAAEIIAAREKVKKNAAAAKKKAEAKKQAAAKKATDLTAAAISAAGGLENYNEIMAKAMQKHGVITPEKVFLDSLRKARISVHHMALSVGGLSPEFRSMLSAIYEGKTESTKALKIGDPLDDIEQICTDLNLVQAGLEKAPDINWDADLAALLKEEGEGGSDG